MNHDPTVRLIDNPSGLADCPGISVAGVACDIRQLGNQRLDLALIHSTLPMHCAGVFTVNDVCAAPVRVCKETLRQSKGKIAGCVINSGNANACTGEQGLADAREMAALARAASESTDAFLVSSTGRIGRPLPMENVRAGIRQAVGELDVTPEASEAAAVAILTSDTRRKVATARFGYNGKTYTVAGMAKGAGMIEPNMATMLAYLVTDLKVEPMLLREMLHYAVQESFNAISIDGDMSTNDTVLLFANGASGTNAIESNDLFRLFKEAVCAVCFDLAEKIVGDGEKITKVVELVVQGAPSRIAAEKIARSVGNSLLVKSSWYGSDPNWGRIADAAGAARVGLIESSFDIHYDDTPALLGGKPQEHHLDLWKAIVARKRFKVTLDLHQGDGTFRLLTTDLSEAYVNFNKSE